MRAREQGVTRGQRSSSTRESRPRCRARSNSLVLIGLLVFSSCGSPPTPPGALGARRPEIPVAEFERRVEAIEKLREEGRYQEALLQISRTVKEWPPENLRRRLQRMAYEIRRSQFYREHPLHLSLDSSRLREQFGTAAELRIKITNLGSERLRLPVTHRTLWQALTFQEKERSVLLLRVESRDLDGFGSGWSNTHQEEVELGRDLVLAPGGSEIVTTTLPLEATDKSLVRIVRIGAIYRPIVIDAEDGERRYDPLEFPEVVLRVFQPSHAKWADGGLRLLETCVEGEVSARSEALFVAAAGLPEEQLKGGLDLLTRVTPNLDPLRQRRALAALSLLSGTAFANDPVLFLGWWQQEGRLLSGEELLVRAGLGTMESGGRLVVGE